MSKKKEYWRRHDNMPLKFRIWDLQLQRFSMIAWMRAQSNRTFIIEFKGFDHDRYVLQQCTGCTDKKHNFIYEGDILETDEAGWIGVVVFGDGRFSLEDSNGGFSAMPNWNGCKIIGNVYQNPELMP